MAYKLWIDKVKYSGDWDHKDPIQGKFYQFQAVPGVGVFDFDAWSNMHYGYVGASGGFGLIELLAGAGTAQLLNSAKGEDTYYFGAIRQGTVGPQTFFDWPEDQRAIAFGYHLWVKYGSDLTEEQFLQELKVWNLTTQKGPREASRGKPNRGRVAGTK